MIKLANNTYEKNKDSLCIGTHNGIFHCDEIIAISILDILYKDKKDIYVLRTRENNLLEKANLLVDIGGGKFDHHQKGGNGKRENDVEYASAGLIWREFGKYLLELKSQNKLDKKTIEELFNKIDEDIIQNIDKEDNGQNNTTHQFQFINKFLPDWQEKNIDYDFNFKECVNIVSTILDKIISSYISKELAKKEIFDRIKSEKYHLENILCIPSQTIPWTEILINYNEISEEKIDFVVFPYPAGGYALQCVPPSIDNPFGQRITLPEEWGGETEQLKNITGVKSATFCHKGRFFARANEYKDIINLCLLASDKKNIKKRTLE